MEEVREPCVEFSLDAIGREFGEQGGMPGDIECWRRWKHHATPYYDAATTMFHGMHVVRWVMSPARFPPEVALCIQTKEVNFQLIRPQNILSHALRVLHVPFLQSPGVLCPGAIFSGVASIWPLSHEA